MEGLTEGRMVHYVTSDERHLPAVVVYVDRRSAEYEQGGVVNLQVFENDANGLSFHVAVVYAHSGMRGTWHWIEKA